LLARQRACSMHRSATTLTRGERMRKDKSKKDSNGRKGSMAGTSAGRKLSDTSDTSDTSDRDAIKPNPPRTKTGKIASPKFGSAGSGGAELEPGPERD
jgi:hypothetical protein